MIKLLDSDKQNFETLQSLEELITALSTNEQTKYNQIIRSLKIPNSVFENYSSWSEDCYTRNCIAENENFELILLCWQKGQITPIHNHGGEECWVRIIKGEFKETIYTTNEVGELKLIKAITSKANDVTYMKDFMGVHSIENLSNEKSLSLHLYAKPIRSCEIYDEESGEFVNKNLAYDTVAPLVGI